MCGGAYGIEQAVGAGGAVAVVLGLAGLSAVYALPQALMVAELSAAFPVAGSSLYWVEAALGERWALVNAAALSLGMVFDAAIWPGLLTAYAAPLLPALGDARVALGAQAGAVLVACAANVVGLRLVVPAVAAATAVTVAPFLLLLPAAWGARARFDGAGAGALPAVSPAGGALIATTLAWAFQGFANVGALAGEVRDPQRAFPRALSLLVGLMFVTYAVPVTVGVALQPDLAAWTPGSFTAIFGGVAPWLGVATTVGSSVVMLTAGLTCTGAYARFVAAAAAEGYLPLPLLGAQRAAPFGTPAPAIALLGATTLALVSTSSFAWLLAFDTMLNLVSQTLVVVSFAHLRAARPGLQRPFRAPLPCRGRGRGSCGSCGGGGGGGDARAAGGDAAAAPPSPQKATIDAAADARADARAAWALAAPSLAIAVLAAGVTAAAPGGAAPVAGAVALAVVAYAVAAARDATRGCGGRWPRPARLERAAGDKDEKDVGDGINGGGDAAEALLAGGAGGGAA